jgi:hypothetical protein
VVGISCVDASECALCDSTIELCGSGALIALHAAVVGLEHCAIERCTVGMHLADCAQVGMMDSCAAHVSWGLVFIPEGGLLGLQLNQTSLCLYNCDIEANLFVGYGRSGDTDIQNTTITGEIDTVEVLRKKGLDDIGPDPPAASDALSRDEKTTATGEATREQVLRLHSEMVLEFLAQAYRMRAHNSGLATPLVPPRGVPF